MSISERMLTLTSAAASRFKAVLESHEARDSYLRVYITQGCQACGSIGYGMALEKLPQEGDSVAEASGVKILVDKQSAQYLKGAQIDYVEGFQRSGFIVNNPNIKSTCGCGH